LQSLYLIPNTPASLKLDGPSLLLVEPGAASRRFPLRRLSHIVLGGALNVEIPAQAACLGRRISLTFLGESSRLAGFALPPAPRRDSVYQRVECFLSSPGWNVRYSDWLRASARRRLLLALENTGWDPPESCLLAPVLRDMWEARLVGLGLSRDEARCWISFDHALLASRCARFLAHAGVEPSVLAAGPVLSLSDWVLVQGWQSYADLEWLLRRLGPMLGDVRTNWRRRLTEFAEARARRDDRRIEELWAAFLAFVSLQIAESRLSGQRTG
jgi:hypothetical protein